MQLTSDQQAKLTRMATEQGRAAETLVQEAVERFLNYDEWFSREVDKRLAAADRANLSNTTNPQDDRQPVSGLMLVRWTQPAADDLLHICDYTAERFGAAQARRVADAIYETAASLQDMPNRGRKGRKPDTREMLISGFPFIIIYRVGQDAVEIARILHTSQQWPQSP